MELDSTLRRSRRALLGGAVAALAATVASALGKPDRALAFLERPVWLDTPNVATDITGIFTPGRTALSATTSNDGGTGLEGFAEAPHGATFGTIGRNRSDTGIGSLGWSAANSTGVMGYSNGSIQATVPAAVPSTGVYGFANDEGTDPRGVFGDSPNGIGVSGASVQGTGVNGHSQVGYGVRGVSRDGTGIEGSGHNGGVIGESLVGIGVFGVSDSGIGVRGRSQDQAGVRGESSSSNGVSGYSADSDAVDGFSTNGSGVRGSSFSHTAAGVTGSGRTGVIGFTGNPLTVPRAPANTGVYGCARGPEGRGGQFTGAAAQITLRPSKGKDHPASGEMGDFFVDVSGDLWFCKGVTTWIQLA